MARLKAELAESPFNSMHISLQLGNILEELENNLTANLASTGFVGLRNSGPSSQRSLFRASKRSQNKMNAFILNPGSDRNQ
jgi:hypothetical protein